jgi:hypothetical protein
MRKSIDTFNNKIYGKKKIGIYEVEPNYGNYTPQEEWYFDVDTTRVYRKPLYNETGSLSFSRKIDPSMGSDA